MATSYRVIDLRTDTIRLDEQTISDANSPEEAALKALGVDLVRGGRGAKLQARVYYQLVDQPLAMVRLYQRMGSEAPPH